MGFAFRRKESIDEAARRVAGRQLEKAVDELGTADAETLPATVHGVRKRTKRVRAVARLVRSGIGKRYGRVNEAARDAAAELSAVRDAAALLGTFDALVVASDPDQLTDGLVLVRRALVARADATAAVDVDRAVELLTRARGAVDDWAFDDGLDVLARGLDVTYRRGRKALRAAVREPTPEAFHEWRKATKHLWYQTQLLRDAAPSVLRHQARSFHHLGDALGDDHDLAVLVAMLGDDVQAFGGPDAVRAAVDLAADRRADLERRAVGLGARLYVEKPKAFVARMTGLWEVWLEHGDEEPTGEIRSIAGP